MTSPTGGKFIVTFNQSGNIIPAALVLNNGTGPATPSAPGTTTNIEVFTSTSISTPPAPDSGFQGVILDHGGTIDSGGFLTGTHLVLGQGDFMVSDSVTGLPTQSAAEIDLGSGAQTVMGAGGDTMVGGTGDQILDALNQGSNPVTILGGTGNESIWGAAGDSINAGSGARQIFVGTGSTITGGASGKQIITIESHDTVFATSGTAQLGINGGDHDLINIASNVASSAAYSYVIGQVGDTITAGSGATAIDATRGSMTVALAPSDTAAVAGIVGANGVNGGATVTGGAGQLDFNPNTVTAAAGTGDRIDLSGSSGSATINAFSFFVAGSPVDGTQLTAVNDTILASNGADSMWGGPGDWIGAGSVGGAGSGTFVHSTTVAGATMQFGTFNSDTTGTSSTASDSVFNFSTVTGANDSLFYPHASAGENTTILASASFANGNTTLTLPDGTKMTLIGITQAELTTLNTAGVLFKSS